MKQRTLLFVLFLLSTLTANAQTLINGIYYEGFDMSAKTVKVTKNPNKYSGSVVIPATVVYMNSTYSVTSIGENAFRDCSGLTSVDIPNSVASIGSSAFRDCSGLTSVVIPNSVTEMGIKTFQGCSGLTSVIIGNSVTSIGRRVFSDCSSLTEVTISNSVTTIGNYAFFGCSSLTSLSIPNSVTSIGECAFYCFDLTDIYCYAEQVPEAKFSFFELSFSSATLHVPAASVEAYKATEPWSGFGSIVALDEPVAEDIAINEKNFPDENFRSYLLSQDYGSDALLTSEEIANITEIDVQKKGIQTIQGIEYFTAITRLNCYNNNLTSIDISKNTSLKKFDCGKNNLTYLDVSRNTALTELRFTNNQLNTIDLSNNVMLMDLGCGNNLLTSLNLSSNTALTDLDCYSNQLTSLDLSKNIELKYIDCNSNLLTSLDLSNSPEIEELYCYNNRLSKLSVSGCSSLTRIEIYQNSVKGNEMDAFVESLPTISNKFTYMSVIYNENESNVITTTQVAAAKAKGWKPLYYGYYPAYYSYTWLEYEGSEPTLLGDVNGDGVVNGTDIQAVINLIVEGEYDAKADVNNDGIINGTDIQEVINIIVGIE